MYIEQRLEELEREVRELREKVSTSEQTEKFVSPMELAEIMGCSRNTISNKINSGDIYATRKTGDPRIPMSQFYKSDPVNLLKRKPERLRKAAGAESMKSLVFGER